MTAHLVPGPHAALPKRRLAAGSASDASCDSPLLRTVRARTNFPRVMFRAVTGSAIVVEIFSSEARVTPGQFVGSFASCPKVFGAPA